MMRRDSGTKQEPLLSKARLSMIKQGHASPHGWVKVTVRAHIIKI